MEGTQIVGEETCLLQPKVQNEQGLLMAFSDDPTAQMTEETKPYNNSSNTKGAEVERVSCECCGTSEECTPTYISRVKEKFYGKWLCGLCSEAVQEKKRKYRTFSNEQALEAHMNICKQFNMGTRIHPELSLADAVISFTRKRSQRRDPAGSFTPQQQMERSCICPISNKA